MCYNMNHEGTKMSRTFSKKNSSQKNESAKKISRKNKEVPTTSTEISNENVDKNSDKNSNKNKTRKSSAKKSHNCKSKSNGVSKFEVIGNLIISFFKAVFYIEVFILSMIVALELTTVNKKTTFTCKKCGCLNTVTFDSPRANSSTSVTNHPPINPKP